LPATPHPKLQFPQRNAPAFCGSARHQIEQQLINYAGQAFDFTLKRHAFREAFKGRAPAQSMSLHVTAIARPLAFENIRSKTTMADDTIVKDSNGAQLNDGDSVTLIKDLKVKGTSETIKRGTLVKNIRLNGNPGEVECNTKQVKGLVLKTEFVKKA
jgi:protein PhnA